MKKSILAVGLMCVFMFCGSKGEGQVSSNSSVSATGTVYDVYSVNGVKHLKIERSDGSKVAARCNDNSDIALECNSASIGEPSWGRATCVSGNCAWSCLEVVTECADTASYYSLSGTVVSKDTCAGELYLTILSGGGEVRAPCYGGVWDDCNNADINDSVSTQIRFYCAEADWVYVNVV